MVNSKRVKMIQSPSLKWALVAPKGHAMVDGLAFSGPTEAENWCKSYISSFATWSYEIIPYNKGKKND